MDKAVTATKWCPSCNGGAGAYVAMDLFWGNKRRYDGKQSKCIACMKAFDRDNPIQSRGRRLKSKNKDNPFAGHGGQLGKDVIADYIDGVKSEDSAMSVADQKNLAAFLAGED